MMEDWNSEMMQKFGYERVTLESEPSRWIRAKSVLGEVPEILRYYARRLYTFARIIGIPPADAKEGQALICNSNPRAWELQPHWSLPDPPATPPYRPD